MVVYYVWDHVIIECEVALNPRWKKRDETVGHIWQGLLLLCALLQWCVGDMHTPQANALSLFFTLFSLLFVFGLFHYAITMLSSIAPPSTNSFFSRRTGSLKLCFSSPLCNLSPLNTGLPFILKQYQSSINYHSLTSLFSLWLNI